MNEELMTAEQLRELKESVIINYEMNLGQSHCVFIKGKYHYLNK